MSSFIKTDSHLLYAVPTELNGVILSGSGDEHMYVSIYVRREMYRERMGLQVTIFAHLVELTK